MLTRRMLAVFLGAGLGLGCSFPTSDFRGPDATVDVGLGGPADRPPAFDLAPDRAALDASPIADGSSTCNADVACAAGSAMCKNGMLIAA